MKTRRVTITVLLLVGALSGAAWAQAGTVGAAISYLDGIVTIDGKAAGIGDAVPLGSTIVTAAQSECEIVFNSRNAIRLSADTAFVFNPGNLQVGSELKKGSLALVLKKVSTVAAGPGFTVRTSSAVAGVRGTSFFISAVDEKTTYICSCNGAVHVEDLSGGSARDMVSAHHKAYVFTTGATGVAVTDSTLLYHTDADLDSLAKDIGVGIDWTTPDR